MNNTPKIRFKGYTDVWEQRKLGEMYVERNEKGNDNLQILSVSIHSGVSDKELDEENLGKFVRRSEDKSKYKHVYTGDLIFNMMRAWQGAIGVAKSEGMISPAYISAIPNEDVYPLFMDYAMRRKEAIEEINNLSYGITDFRKRLYWDSFVHVTCQLPSVEEQEKIYKYFKTLDNLITFHQRKCDGLKNTKKFMLQKMFPKNGEQFPEIRFSGFTDAWEQRKLGDITEKVIGGGTPKTSVAEYWDGDIPWIQSSNVQENEMFNFEIPKSITQEGLDNSSAKLIPENSIAVVTHVGVGKLVFVPFSYTTSQDFTSLSELKTDAKFTCYSLYQRIQNDLHIVQGSAIKGITKEDLLSKEIMIPELEEQKKIGEYFFNLDNLITFHQRKSDQLKMFKKFMLQNMFP